MRKMPVAVLALAAATSCWAADFGLSATIRAGMSNQGDWEIGIGPSGNSGSNNANLQPYHPNNVPTRFELGYTSATNRAFLRYYHASSPVQTVTFAPGGQGLGAGSVWTIPVGSLFVEASRVSRATSITVDQLAFGGGVQVIQSPLTTSLTASQDRTRLPVRTGLTSAVVFRTGATGDWLFSGRIAFSGLSEYTSPGAHRSDLLFMAGISGTSAPASVPEPPVSGLLAVGLIAIGVRAKRKRSGEGVH